MTGPTVLVVGDVIEDIQVKILGPIRADTDTPAEIHRHMGGSAANTAAWLASDGVPVEFFGRVGAADVDALTADFLASGVTAHLEADPDRPTGTIVMLIEGETRTMLTDRGANVALHRDSLPTDAWREASWVHVTGYSLFHHDHPEFVADLITQAAARATPVMVDASSAGFLQDFGPARFLDLVTGARVLRCNRDEATVLSGGLGDDEALSFLAERFAVVVVTDGSRGAVVGSGADRARVAAVPVGAVVDPTGAGDAFNAGLLAGLSRSQTIEQAAAHAAVLAARAVTTWGARP